MPALYSFIHHLLGETKFPKIYFWQISDTNTYAYYANCQYKCFTFLRQSTKTDLTKKHLIAKIFAKMPILAVSYKF